ncbi:MAG: nucleotidyl transferase AbiEii/AbiGii toxin family protein [Pseudomonadota bacterium]
MNNIGASVRARLLNVAKAQGADFNQVLVRFALERTGYRLSQSEHADHFLLKGALLFTLWYDMPHRATRDADLPAPRLRTYPVYTVVAEKRHAIALLGMTNSRMKDYLDLSVLLDRETLDIDLLAQALKATFERHGMAVPAELPVGVTDEFAHDSSRQALWQAFIKKNELAHESLPSIVDRLRVALGQR